MRAGVALGSNLGDRVANLRKARERISELNKVRLPILASTIYETVPVGCEEAAPKFLNATVEIEYVGEPKSLLLELEKIERSLGRVVARTRNASRPIDLDLLYFGQMEIDLGGLQLPHPRMTHREFVLRPLADIRPDLILPNQTEPVSVLLERSIEPGAVVRFDGQW